MGGGWFKVGAAHGPARASLIKRLKLAMDGLMGGNALGRPEPES